MLEVEIEIFLASDSPAFRHTTFTRDGVRRGFIAMQPLAIGVLAHAVTFGLLAQGAGFSIFDAVLMSATVYSGTAQTAAVSVLATGAGVVAAVSTVVLLNARYILYGAALRPWLGQVSPVQAYGSLFLLGDGSWLLAMRAYEAGDRDAGYVLGTGLGSFAPWIAGTMLGSLIGKWIPAPQLLALDFLLVAWCAAMMVGMARTRASLWPGGVALLAALVTDRLAPAGWPIVAAGLAGALTAYLRHGDTADRAQ